MEDFIDESNFTVLFSKTFNYDIDSLSSYFENPENLCNTPMKNQYFYFYTKNNESFLKTEGYVKGTYKSYSILYNVGKLIKTPFKHYRIYKVDNWNGNAIKFNIFFINYFYQNTCENKTIIYKILSTKYRNDEEKEIYNDFLKSLRFIDYNEAYIKGIEFMINDKSLINEIRYSILLKNSRAEDVIKYIKSSELYIELLDSDNLKVKVNGTIGNPGVSIDLYDKEGELTTQYTFDEEIYENSDCFKLQFTKDYSKNSEIFQKFIVRIIKISNNDSFLYVKKQILNIITFDKLNLLKYLFLMFFKKIRDKFKN
jgi:hypothetical protein